MGHTYVGDVVLPYPVSCDPATLLRFRDLCATDIKKWRCFVSGKYDLSVVDPSPLFHLYDVMPAFTRFGNPLSLQALIGAVIYSTLGTRILVLAPVGHHLTYVVVEELFNEITRFPVWLIESLQAFNLVGWHGVLIKTFVHGTLHLFPFPLRLVVHMVWNTVVTCIDFNCRPFDSTQNPPSVASGTILPFDEESVANGAQFTKVAVMLYKKEWTLLALEFLSNWPRLKRLS